MTDRLAAVLDHVAVAVGDRDAAEVRWCKALGGGRLVDGGDGPFRTRQIVYANDARLELIAPGEPVATSFVRRFLDRFGATVHHVTLKVPDLVAGLATLERAGLEVVDVNLDARVWREAFLRPVQVGGVVVQVAQSPYGVQDWAREAGVEVETPADDAASLLGPLLRHPDPDAARSLWSVLGAQVTEVGGALRCTWPDSPLDVVIRRGEPAGPIGLRMSGTADLPAEDGVGPDVFGDG